MKDFRHECCYGSTFFYKHGKVTSYVKLMWKRNRKKMGKDYNLSLCLWVLKFFGNYSKSITLLTLRFQALVWNWFSEFILLSSVNAKLSLINDSVSQSITTVLNHWQSMASGFLRTDIMNNWRQMNTGKKRSLQSYLIIYFISESNKADWWNQLKNVSIEMMRLKNHNQLRRCW